MEIFKRVGNKAIGEYLTDFYTGWKILVIAAGIGFLLCLIYMIFLRVFARILIWLTIIGFIVLMGTLGAFFFNKYTKVNDDYKTAYQVLAYGCWIIDAIVLLLVLCLYKDIQISLSIIVASSRFMFANPAVVLVPIIASALELCFVIYWVISSAHILSLGDISQWERSPFPNFYLNNEKVRDFAIYLFFGFFWITCCIFGINQFIISARSEEHTSEFL